MPRDSGCDWIAPGNNLTVVVSGAAGACRTAAGQVAKMLAISIIKYIPFLHLFSCSTLFSILFEL